MDYDLDFDEDIEQSLYEPSCSDEDNSIGEIGTQVYAINSSNRGKKKKIESNNNIQDIITINNNTSSSTNITLVSNNNTSEIDLLDQITLKPNIDGEFKGIYDLFLNYISKPNSEEHKRLLLNLFNLFIAIVCNDLTTLAETTSKDQVAIICYNNVKNLLNGFPLINKWITNVMSICKDSTFPIQFVDFVNSQLQSLPKKWGTFEKKFSNYKNRSIEDKMIVYNGNRFFEMWLEIKRVINNYLYLLYPKEIPSGKQQCDVLIEVRKEYWKNVCKDKCAHAYKVYMSSSKNKLSNSNDDHDMNLQIEKSFNKKVKTLDDTWYPNEWITFVYCSIPAGGECFTTLNGGKIVPISSTIAEMTNIVTNTLPPLPSLSKTSRKYCNNDNVNSSAKKIKSESSFNASSPTGNNSLDINIPNTDITRKNYEIQHYEKMIAVMKDLNYPQFKIREAQIKLLELIDPSMVLKE